MSAERTIDVRGLRHAVRRENVSTSEYGLYRRVYVECGGYVDGVVSDKGSLLVTCVRCLSGVAVYGEIPSLVGVSEHVKPGRRCGCASCAGTGIEKGDT